MIVTAAAALLMLFSAGQVQAGGGGSCAQSRKCCDGQDASCVVQSQPLTEILNDPTIRDVPCYCDHGCLDVGDCCDDFKDYCGGKIFIGRFATVFLVIWKTKTL